MLASIAVITLLLLARCAKASSVEIPITGRFEPKASPCATPQAMRNPVNDPGPAPKAMPSNCTSVNPACVSNSCNIGRRSSECRCPAKTSRLRNSPSIQSAIEQYSEEVSKAIIFKVASSKNIENFSKFNDIHFSVNFCVEFTVHLIVAVIC